MGVAETVFAGFILYGCYKILQMNKTLQQERKARKEIRRVRDTDELRQRKLAVRELAEDRTLAVEQRMGAQRFCQLIDEELVRRAVTDAVADTVTDAVDTAANAAPVTPAVDWSQYDKPAFLRRSRR